MVTPHEGEALEHERFGQTHRRGFVGRFDGGRGGRQQGRASMTAVHAGIEQAGRESGAGRLAGDRALQRQRDG
jgi:hypothetical protein